jgi:hypothetical protein
LYFKEDLEEGGVAGEVEDDRRASGVTSCLNFLLFLVSPLKSFFFFYHFHASALRVRGRFRGSTSKGIPPPEIKIYKTVIKK